MPNSFVKPEFCCLDLSERSLDGVSISTSRNHQIEISDEVDHQEVRRSISAPPKTSHKKLQKASYHESGVASDTGQDNQDFFSPSSSVMSFSSGSMLFRQF